jgi:hypothetical protein
MLDKLLVQEHLQRFAEEAVLNSRTLNSPAAEKMDDKELAQKIRKELECGDCPSLLPVCHSWPPCHGD